MKFVRFQLSTNMGALAAFLGAVLVGLPAPLTAVQVLWVNIIVDGPPALALGADPTRAGTMDQPPRARDAAILPPARLLRLLRAGLVMAAGTLAVLTWALSTGSEERALTLAFTTFVLFQFFNALNARVKADGTVFDRDLFTNRYLWISLFAVLALQVAAVQFPPFQGIFDTVALGWSEWFLAAAVASTVLVVEECWRALRRLSQRRR